MRRAPEFLLALALLIGLAFVGWMMLHRSGPATPRPARAAAAVGRSAPVEACDQPRALAPAAQSNQQSLETAPWSVFGRVEAGWEVYLPQAAQEIASDCPAASPGFAAALAAWQKSRGLPADGIMNVATLEAMRLAWLKRRPFAAQTAGGACPAPPPAAALVTAAPTEGYGGKSIQLMPQALAAYRALAAAARKEKPQIAADPRLLTIFSGYRDPSQDAAFCATSGECSRITRASCSAHRTGLAMDLYLGSAPGFPPESSDDINRLFQSRSAAYHWLVANAARFGFVNYPFEPWHWEWTGKQP